jgi:hypothetical protein
MAASKREGAEPGRLERGDSNEPSAAVTVGQVLFGRRKRMLATDALRPTSLLRHPARRRE